MNTARRVAEAPKGNGRSAGADRPLFGGAVERGTAYQVSGYWTLYWALVPMVEPQSHSCRRAAFAVLAP